MTIYAPYTYHIGWTEQNKHYYGVRMANECPPEDDLWTEYHTSSNMCSIPSVKNMASQMSLK